MFLDETCEAVVGLVGALLSGSLGGKGELVADIPVAAALLWELVSVGLLRSKHDSIGVVDKACLAALNAALRCDVHMNSFFFCAQQWP